MPIYEFYCPDCHQILSFLSARVNPAKVPACPHCGQHHLSRRVSAFAIHKGRAPGDVSEELHPDLDQARLVRAMEALGPEVENLGEDPRQAARMMRQFFDAGSLPLNPGMEEALRRMEAGEDPERVEDDLGEVLDQDPLVGEEGPARARRTRVQKAVLPPRVDPTIYEM